MLELVGVRTTSHWGNLSRRRRITVPVSTNILRTCKQIHNEAAPILYGGNTFYFGLPNPCTGIEPQVIEPAEVLQLDSQCLLLFGYRAESWHELLFAIQASFFARFLYQIGKENAARITTLRFVVRDLKASRSLTTGQAMKVVTHLLHRHAPGLRDLRIILTTHFDEEPKNGVYRPYRVSKGAYPSVELVLHSILKNSVPKLSGLKRLEFQGFGRDPSVKEELARLEKGRVKESTDVDHRHNKRT